MPTTETVNLSPREIVSELDRFIVGQNDAKRAVAIALRNRWRRQQLPEGLREEVMPKNILMIGPTGVGKTEIARRLARLANAPFLKVEATKFTEVGYVGRDVESIVRDLVEVSITQTRDHARKEVQAKAELAAEERLVTALVGEGASGETRMKFRRMLREGAIETREVEVQIADAGGGMPIGMIDLPGAQGIQMQRFILDIQSELGITIVLVEHDMGLVMDIADRVLVLDFGQRIALGTPDEVQSDPAVIAAYLGSEFA